MKNANELTAAQIAAITPEQVYVVYSGKPGCACGCRGNYRVNPQHLAFATKHRGYEYDANEVSLAQVKRVLRIVQQDLDKLDCVSEEFASVKIETGYETFRVYAVYILPEAAKQFEAERAGKSCHDCGGDCNSILAAAQKSLETSQHRQRTCEFCGSSFTQYGTASEAAEIIYCSRACGKKSRKSLATA